MADWWVNNDTGDDNVAVYGTGSVHILVMATDISVTDGDGDISFYY